MEFLGGGGKKTSIICPQSRHSESPFPRAFGHGAWLVAPPRVGLPGRIGPMKPQPKCSRNFPARCDGWTQVARWLWARGRRNSLPTPTTRADGPSVGHREQHVIRRGESLHGHARRPAPSGPRQRRGRECLFGAFRLLPVLGRPVLRDAPTAQPEARSARRTCGAHRAARWRPARGGNKASRPLRFAVTPVSRFRARKKVCGLLGESSQRGSGPNYRVISLFVGEPGSGSGHLARPMRRIGRNHDHQCGIPPV